MTLDSRRLVVAVFALAAMALPAIARADVFLQTNLVSDVPGLAAVTDPNLKNAWGISESGSSPFWVSNEVTNKATLYNTAGAIQGLVVSVPSPTGQVFNSTGSSFVLSDGTAATFIFASLNGTILGWNAGAGTTALLAATAGASYDGLALGTSAQGNVLYAANNNGAGSIDVYNSTFQATTLAGTFNDPMLPAGFKPYNIQNLGGTLYVTYNNAAGGGVVAAFDQNGNFLRQIASNGATGPLSAPWGVALAPTGFGQLGGDLLVGNRGNGMIDAFNPTTGAFDGVLMNQSGNPIVNSGLWGLQFGNGGSGGNTNTLYFSAGIDNYADGLFGSIQFVPEPGPIALISFGAALCGGIGFARRAVARRRAD